ncbi:URA2, partial [Symbiodinium necroappetens]
DLRNLNVISLPFTCLLPLPSRAPAPGEKAVFVGEDPALDGWPCSCGPQGQPWT